VPRFPSLGEIAEPFGEQEVQVLPVPHDCRDGSLGAFWRRPEGYLDPSVRHAISGFAQLPLAIVNAGISRSRRDLDSGRWEQRFGHLRRQDHTDLGYRLIIGRPR